MKSSIPDNFTFIVLEQPVLKSSSLIIAYPDISSIKGTSIFMKLYSPGFKSTSVLGMKGKDMFRKC